MTGNDRKDSVRRFIPLQETMKRLHGEIERNLFAAEITCRKMGDPICRESTCPFLQAPTLERPVDCCTLVKIRELIGNPFVITDGLEFETDAINKLGRDDL